MEKYEVIKQNIMNGQILNRSICECDTEEYAKEIVGFYRQKYQNQLYFYRKIN